MQSRYLYQSYCTNHITCISCYKIKLLTTVAREDEDKEDGELAIATSHCSGLPALGVLLCSYRNTHRYVQQIVC